MNIIKEPDNIDFVVEQVKLSKADKVMISQFFQHYKKTGEMLKYNTVKPKHNNNRKKAITKP